MKRRPLPPSYEPHACVVLAIDPGAKSGWAYFVRGDLIAWGVGNTHVDRMAAAICALDCARVAGLPLVVVGERWMASRRPGADKRMNPATLAGLGASWGRWEAALEEAGVPKARVMRVAQSIWKARIVGSAWTKHDDTIRAIRNRVAALRCSEIYATDDEFAAMGIGLWAIRAGEVAAKLPKPRAPRAPRTKGQAA